MNNKPIQRTGKRAVDIFVSATVLLLALPVLIFVAILIRWRMGSPILFRQQRPGLDEQPFTLFKFRTMNDARDANGDRLADGDRLTPLGKYLRRTSLDELPQLWNVLRGEMSLVGPRPMRWDYLPYFTPRERLRHSVRPGITGWAQIHGRNEASWDARFENDAWYVENWSLALDYRIVVTTLRQVLRGRGIVVDASSTMQNFDKERRAASAKKAA
ncbi:MAG: sugar transferase [Pirellulales bacterium]|nr:sugar transferase [Pirellulales bacterium]